MHISKKPLIGYMTLGHGVTREKCDKGTHVTCVTAINNVS